MTGYHVIVGAAMVALLYVPDIPFFVLGIASLALIIRARSEDRTAPSLLGRDNAPPQVARTWLPTAEAPAR